MPSTRSPRPDPARIRHLFRLATETGDWQYRMTAWLELAGICVCYYCCEQAGVGPTIGRLPGEVQPPYGNQLGTGSHKLSTAS